MKINRLQAKPLSKMNVPVKPYNWKMISMSGVIANPPIPKPAEARPNAKLRRLSKYSPSTIIHGVSTNPRPRPEREDVW